MDTNNHEFFSDFISHHVLSSSRVQWLVDGFGLGCYAAGHLTPGIVSWPINPVGEQVTYGQGLIKMGCCTPHRFSPSKNLAWVIFRMTIKVGIWKQVST